MKKFLIGLITTALIVFHGCAGMQESKTIESIPVDVAVMVNDTSCIEIEPEIEGWAPELSAISYVIDDTGYVKLFSGITVSDTTRLWNDLNILLGRGIIDVNMFLNSPGGSAFDGIAIARHILNFREKGMRINIECSGVVASAAIPILATGTTKTALEGTIFMVHEAALWKWPGRETASDIRSQAELMNLLRDSYMDIMVQCTTTDRKTWEDMEGRTTWFNVEKAKELGLIDD